METTGLVTHMAALRVNTEDADVTLKCQGEVVKAHSFVLWMMWSILSLHSDLEYKDYLMENMKPNMLVHCNKDSAWEGLNVKEGTIGRVTQNDINDGPVVSFFI